MLVPAILFLPLILLLAVLVILAMFVWRRLRLRRAFHVFGRQLKWSKQNAPRDKLVLDVGAGPNPHIRADVICEKFLHDDFHRGAGVAMDRPLVVGDASALPFKSGVFDFVISNHVIEHLDDPKSFFEEAGRVGHRGLFTCPGSQAERLYSYEFHLWSIEHKDDTLYFTAKPQAILDPPVHDFFARYVITDLYKLDQFLLDYGDVINIFYSWEGIPKIVVEGVPFTPKIQASTKEADVAVKLTLSNSERIRSILKRWVRTTIHWLLSSHRKVDLARILACPQCHGDIIMSDSQVRCPACALSYPIKNNIPIMLLEHAVPQPKASVDS